ncbi:MAG: NAD(P)-binding domain-containing protein [Octadecabacter sp.]|nr:NAD(P)-binding domain-containing protein [Octadecabacter sp.]
MIIAFIGLGTMGAPMAKCLAAVGIDLCVYDIDARACAAFSDTPNCRIAASPCDAAKNARVLITMLPESHHVYDAILGEEGAIGSLVPGAIVVEMSTGSLPDLKILETALLARGVRLVDAPVGRSPKEAANGSLLVLAGGAESDLTEVAPLLKILGNEIIYNGPLGSGLKMKLVNNYMSMIGMAMTAEVLNVAQVLGLDLKQTVRVLQSTPAGQGQINTNYPKKVLNGDISPDFPLRLGLKDIGLGLTLAQSAGAPTPLGLASQQMFLLAGPWGRAHQDCTAMLHLFSDLSGPTSLQNETNEITL